MEVKSLFRKIVFFPEVKKRPKEALLCSKKKAFSKKILQRTSGLRLDKIKEIYWDKQKIESFFNYKKIARKLNLISGLGNFGLN